MTERSALQTYATFQLGDWLLGLPSSAVREVIKEPRITQVPFVSPVLRGVFNARGELVTVIDLRRRLGMPDADTDACTHVILPTPDGTVSLLVDREGDVLEVERSAFEPAPGGLVDAARECVAGAYKLTGRLLIVLDAARTLEIGEARAAASDATRGQED